MIASVRKNVVVMRRAAAQRAETPRQAAKARTHQKIHVLERLEAGETLSAEEQSWVDAKLDRIDELMQKLGLSYDDDEEEEEDEKQEDMMRLLRGN